ncbi:hypothetical protein AKJ37_03565 [candidate division MSBL1 archaeon SCGC-AAA259I09]|uniref:Uncharacterized protein n=1 Tax=candidate division MSBL1 archaeon SCGC-AAA259I09 TaxID=1698267 RepID=A0A133USK5_9EURY|nr:hypothetical protein AKJ37_03565 [candidate division MSBL1 archaeon SCGC-AAA259I09]
MVVRSVRSWFIVRERTRGESRTEVRTVGKEEMPEMRSRDGGGGQLARRLAGLPELPPLREGRHLTPFLFSTSFLFHTCRKLSSGVLPQPRAVAATGERNDGIGRGGKKRDGKHGVWRGALSVKRSTISDRH